MKHFIFIFCTIFSVIQMALANPLVIPLAGRGAPDSTISPTFTGDGGPATLAQLINPFDAVSDGKGNWYVLDTSHRRVRLVDKGGHITTIAGPFFDNGAAGAFADPMGLAIWQGELYVSDTFNHLVRKIDPVGKIHTVAGTGLAGDAGDGEAATNASLANPSGLCFDHDGALYIADQANHRIRRIDTSGVMTTVAGMGHRGYSGDEGPASQAKLADPSGVFWSNGWLYIADRTNHVIRAVDPDGIISTIAGSGEPGARGDGGTAVAAQLLIPSRVVVNGLGELFIADRGNNRIRRVDTEGIITTVLGVGNVRLNRPFGIGVGTGGTMVVVDTENHKLWHVDAPVRSAQMRVEKSEIVANGEDSAGLLVSLSDRADERVTFQIHEGKGSLSTLSGESSGGLIGTRLTSQYPGMVVIQAKVAGALPVLAQVDVKPVSFLTIHVSTETISANGDDVAIFQTELRGDIFPISYRIAGGEGMLAFPDGGIAKLTSTTPGRVIVEASALGALSVSLSIGVTTPQPWQIADAFENHGIEPILSSALLSRTFHTPGDTDSFLLPVRPGYGFSLLAQNDTPVRADVFRAGNPLLSFNLPGDVFEDAVSETLQVVLSHPDGAVGAYAVRVSEKRVAQLRTALSRSSIAADGSQSTQVSAQVLDRFGQLNVEDDTTQVRFSVVGDAELDALDVVVQNGQARTQLVSVVPGQVHVRAEIVGVAPVVKSVEVLPALILQDASSNGDVKVILGALSGVRGATGVRALVQYDPQVLAFNRFEPVGALVDGTPLVLTPESGSVEVHAAVLGGTIPSDGGRLGMLHFTVLSEGPTVVSLVEGDFGTLSGIFPFGIGPKTGRVQIGQSSRFQALLSFREAFGQRQGDASFDPVWDLDVDGVVGFTDFLLWLEQQ